MKGDSRRRTLAFAGPVWGVQTFTRGGLTLQRCTRFVEGGASLTSVKSRRGLHVQLPERGRRSTANMIFSDTAGTAEAEAGADEREIFSARGMSVEDFFDRSVGEWRSQRSSHNLLWAQFEQITSAISIVKLPATDEQVMQLCKANDTEMTDVLISLKMTWEGESDWDEDENSEGESVMCVVKDKGDERHGRLLRSVGYAETIPAVGKWEMTEDGMFVLETFYDAAAAEERIWFATPDLRIRVSQIRTSSGAGVMTASMSSEIRRLNA